MSDSAYVCNSINKWLSGWIKKSKQVKNFELWEKIHEEIGKKKSVYAIHVKAHNGIIYNELADELAGNESKAFLEEEE